MAVSLTYKKLAIDAAVATTISAAFLFLWWCWHVGSYVACLSMGCILLVSPKWLPGLVVKMRMKLLTRINDGKAHSGQGIEIPSPEVPVTEFKQVYKSKATRGRSEGAALSDLFWYFLSPGPEVHQEQIEDGPKYAAINKLSKQLLNVSQERTTELITKCLTEHLDKTVPETGAVFTHLRDYYMPVFARFYHEVVFGDEGSESDIADITAFATNVIETLKWSSLRDMPLRLKVTEYATRMIKEGRLQAEIPDDLTLEEVALAVQGAFLNTAVVQSSEAMAHATLVMASHRDVANKLAQCKSTDHYVSHFINEVFRLYPLFGIAHRILQDEVPLSDGRVLPKGSVVCFNYPAFHGEGYEDAQAFRPERWETSKVSESNHLPYGMPGNRPCPAQRLSMLYQSVMCPIVARIVHPYSVVEHTRSLPGKGFCMLHRNTPRAEVTGAQLHIALASMKLYDYCDCVVRSLRQFLCAPVIVSEAMELRLCDRFFKGGGAMLPADQVFN